MTTRSPLDESFDLVVHVRVLSIGSSSAVEESDLAVLSASECARAVRFVNDRDRAIFVSAHALLRRTLSEFGGAPPEELIFRTGSHGKPELADAALASQFAFNLSHTRGLVCCAVATGGDIGIDAECLRGHQNVMDIAHHICSTKEWSAIQGSADQERMQQFIERWTLKEAYVKCLGVGLPYPLNTIEFMFDRTRITVGTQLSHAVHWHCAILGVENRFCVAIVAKQQRGGTCSVAIAGHGAPRVEWRRSTPGVRCSVVGS